MPTDRDTAPTWTSMAVFAAVQALIYAAVWCAANPLRQMPRVEVPVSPDCCVQRDSCYTE